MTSPLRGLRVLELSQFIAGPFAGLMLADLGAEVIKIERPDGGDPFRGFGTGAADNDRFAGYSHNFSAFNRNKRSVTIDLGTEPGRELLRDLVRKADVLLENYRPGVLDRMGLDYEALRQDNPGLIYCSISGFSEDGPYRDRPAYDAVGQAFSGILGTLLDPAKPRMRGPTITDQITGMQAAYGVLGALVERGRTGKGSRVEVSMLDASLYHMPDSFTALTQTGLEMASETRAAFSLTFAFRCQDGQLLAIQVSSTEKFWRALLKTIARTDLGDDSRFLDRPARIKNFSALVEELEPIFAAQPRQHWLDLLIAADVPCAPVNGIAEAMSDPEVVHAGLFHDVTHPRRGNLTMMHRAVRLDGEREDDPLPPPDLGEHTDAVLRSFDIAPERLAALRRQGVL
ncbi:formyl-CoA transferase [Sphingomonas vulcanisoli]|uniref:Formyl-CoA transferase n=1 Tax=Sphingomonas vulcanisoli TaxID=1658060 RepID=A0ABX0TSJ6_9SPHN|nr:CaiB/BaiF CoA-transferase family protein [Sphingomonas vulcanisoli]NIJ08488.1 formyl-CoA transferase [Sphingomonas vulcanisoli]